MIDYIWSSNEKLSGMPWETYSNEEKRTKLIGVLVELSKADGVVDGKELLFLLDVGQKYGMSPQQVRAMVYEPAGDIDVPQSELDRMTILYYMLFMMKVDGKVNKNEENLVYHYGFKLGFNESLIREMIIVIKNSIGKTLDPSKLLARIKIYMN